MTDKYRQQAEALAETKEAADTRALSPEETRQTLHELRVHQIELEMQNEELRRAQAELDAVRARYFDLYDLAPVGYCTVSEQGLIEEANLTAATLLGTTRRELVRQPWTRFIAWEDQDIYYQQRKELLATGKPAAFELRMKRKDHPDFWTHLAATRVHEAGQPQGLRIVISDIAERKQDEDIRENVERIIRHDIKGPLINLFSMAQLVMHGEIDAIKNDIFPQILQGIRQIIRLIDAAEPLRLMEKGDYAPRKKNFILNETLDNIQSSLSCLVMQYKATVNMPPADAYPGTGKILLYGEEYLIEDMLMNLIKNAVEASPPGGDVTITCQEEHAVLRLTIHNVGVVPDSVRGSFFDKDSTAGKLYGTGLGTYSAQLIAKAHNGHIVFTSSEAEGTMVTVVLPSGLQS